jgi:hypothetical protein
MKLTYPLLSDPQKFLEDIRQKILAQNGEFSGDLASGEFKIHGVHGEYKTDDQNLMINITKKPFLIPESFIASQLNDYIKSIS